MFGPQHGQEPPPLTREDWKKIEKSMKKPEFLGLLSQYMVEISDPKNKKQYDDYLRQMESEGELPKHMKLVQPKPEFCVKTALIAHANRSQQMKFFINMCSAPQIAKPNFEATVLESGEVGQNWKIPNSMGKIRYDQDKNGNICNTVDAIFHPEAFILAQNKRFQALIINVAIQTAQRQLGERKQNLSKDYIVMKNLKCKGETPALLPVRSIEGKIYNRGEGAEIQRDREGQETKLQKQINQRKKEYQENKQKKQKNQQINDEDLTQTAAIQEQYKGPQRPKFHTIYTYPVEYMDFIEAGVSKTTKIPSALNIQFKIPLVQQFKQIKSLDVNESKILLDAGEKYFIDLSFEQMKVKYKLVPTQSKAKFDKKKKTLRITIPLDKTMNKQQSEQITALNENQESKKTETEGGLSTQNKTQQVIQQNTWQDKSKLLEITEGKVATEIIKKSEIQEKPAKKFVQQIDQDDVNPQLKAIESKPEPQNSKLQELQSSAPSQIGSTSVKFQQARDKAFIIIHLPKYQKSQVQIVHSLNKIFLVWIKNQTTKYLKATISKNVIESDVKVVYVSEYVVINIAKHQDTESIKIVTDEQTYQVFDKELRELRQQIRIHAQQKQIHKKQEEEEKKRNAQSEQIVEKQPQKNTKIELNQAQKPFQKVFSPQFINFKMKMVEELD